MVLAKLFSRAGKKKLQPRERVGFPMLDSMLDVPTDRFGPTVVSLVAEFAAKQATLDLEGLSTERQQAANSASLAAVPDVRDASYQADLGRIAPMDRPEEFRMARRHEFLSTLVKTGLVRLGFTEAMAAELVRQPMRIPASLPVKPKSREWDRQWFLQMAQQFADLRNLYVEGALYLVLSTVHRYRGLGVDAADLIQEGNTSLYQAIDGFDWRREVRFRTYAQFWVQQAVLKALYNNSRTVRVPIWVQKVLGKIRRVQEEGARAGREVPAAEIAGRLGISAEKVEWVLATRRYAVSLDAEVDAGEGQSLAQRLADERLAPIPESIPAGDLRLALMGAMADLPPREQRILQARFGLDGSEPRTLADIAVELGITAERVRQLQEAAMGRLQRPGKLRQLQAFVE